MFLSSSFTFRLNLFTLLRLNNDVFSVSCQGSKGLQGKSGQPGAQGREVRALRHRYMRRSRVTEVMVAKRTCVCPEHDHRGCCLRGTFSWSLTGTKGVFPVFQGYKGTKGVRGRGGDTGPAVSQLFTPPASNMWRTEKCFYAACSFFIDL